MNKGGKISSGFIGFFRPRGLPAAETYTDAERRGVFALTSFKIIGLVILSSIVIGIPVWLVSLLGLKGDNPFFIVPLIFASIAYLAAFLAGIFGLICYLLWLLRVPEDMKRMNPELKTWGMFTVTGHFFVPLFGFFVGFRIFYVCLRYLKSFVGDIEIGPAIGVAVTSLRSELFRFAYMFFGGLVAMFIGVADMGKPSIGSDSLSVKILFFGGYLALILSTYQWYRCYKIVIVNLLKLRTESGAKFLPNS